MNDKTPQFRRSVTIKHASGKSDENVKKQRAALKKMDLAEQICGIPAAELAAEQAAMKVAALKRFARG